MFEINDKDEMKTDSCVSTLSAVQHLEERLTLTIEMNENAQDFYLSKANARLLRAELDGFLGEEEKGTNTEKQFVISYLTPIRGVTKDRAIAYAKEQAQKDGIGSMVAEVVARVEVKNTIEVVEV